MRKTVKTGNILTVLILNTPKRLDDLKNLLPELNKNGVNLLWLGDNYHLTVGEKRNILMNAVKTPYLVFFDDDDEPHEDYTKIILENIEKNPDAECFSITFYKTQNGTGFKEYDFDYRFTRNINVWKGEGANRKKVQGMVPNHVCVWKTEIAKRVPFPSKSLGEDHVWAENQRKLGYSFKKIETNEYLYHYKFSCEKTETRLR